MTEKEKQLIVEGIIDYIKSIGMFDEVKAFFIASIPTEDYPMPEDTVIFQKGVAEGRRLEREEQKWSEEKEKAVDNYADEIIKWEDAHKDWDRQVIRATAYHFFNLQPKQVWSEEDEKAIERAIDCVCTWEIDYCDGDSTISERLKSLHPSWKPSEEQISAIVEALKYLPNNKDEWMVLDNLITDLKKL